MTEQYSKCDCKGCPNELRTFDEVMAGICLEHMELLKDDKYYAGVCWECCRVTIIGNRYHEVKQEGSYKRIQELLIKDKYIFSKGCVHCTGSERANVDWMTINSTSPPTTQVGKSGGFIPIKQNHLHQS